MDGELFHSCTDQEIERSKTLREAKRREAALEEEKQAKRDELQRAREVLNFLSSDWALRNCFWGLFDDF